MCRGILPAAQKHKLVLGLFSLSFGCNFVHGRRCCNHLGGPPISLPASRSPGGLLGLVAGKFPPPGYPPRARPRGKTKRAKIEDRTNALRRCRQRENVGHGKTAASRRLDPRDLTPGEEIMSILGYPAVPKMSTIQIFRLSACGTKVAPRTPNILHCVQEHFFCSRDAILGADLPSTLGGTGNARATPAPCPRHPKPNMAHSPRHARAMPAPRPRPEIFLRGRGV
eukprot:gene25871-biopygen22519